MIFWFKINATVQPGAVMTVQGDGNRRGVYRAPCRFFPPLSGVSRERRIDAYDRQIEFYP